MTDEKRIAGFLFEVGTMRKLMRMHRQVLLTDDMSDSIASHAYRVSIIGWFLAKKEKADLYKTVMMCLLHDMSEARTGDHNWIHKRYVKIFEEEINEEQLGTLPYNDLKELIDEYEARKTKEAIIAKDADLLDQLLLIKEYEWQGNKEATIWLHGKTVKEPKARLKQLKSESAIKLGSAIYDENPSDWWNDIWTSKNRKE
jgi:putative hydrolase of HD superfamily